MARLTASQKHFATFGLYFLEKSLRHGFDCARDFDCVCDFDRHRDFDYVRDSGCIIILFGLVFMQLVGY